MKPQRILLIRLSHLGDVVHALPVFHALRAGFPDARLAWATQSEFAGLLAGLPGLERVVPFRRRGGGAAWLELRAACEAFAPDLAVDAQGNLKSAFCALASGARARVGLARTDWREATGAFAMTARAAPAAGAHALDRAAALIEALVGPSASRGLLTAPAHAFALGLSERELEAGARLLPARGPDAVLHLGAPGDVRSWPAERFAALARGLAAEGRRVLVLSGPAEAELGAELAHGLAGVEGVEHQVGQRGLRELAALFTLAARRGARFVGSDSGPMHLAVACGMRVTCLSGPQSHLRTGPWPPPERGGEHRVLRAGLQPPCAPCLERRCAHPEGPVCMTGIDPEAALASLRSR